MSAPSSAQAPVGVPLGDRLVESIERFDRGKDITTRLGKGKKCHRDGDIASLCTDDGNVSARVKGSSVSSRYDVTISFTKMTGDILKDFELSQSRDEHATDSNKYTQLLPSSWTEITSTCTCADFKDTGGESRKIPKRAGIACKHICACLYELCEVVNEDPRILVNLRK